MGGVDRNDQYRQYYCVRLKSRKVYKYIFWYAFEVTLTNVFILQKFVPSIRHKSYCYLDFRVELAKQLIGEYNGIKRRGRPSLFPTPAVTGHHLPIKDGKRHRCDSCYKKDGKTKWTQWKCNNCGTFFCHTGIPESDCFYNKHKI